MIDLESIYRRTLRECAPDVLARSVAEPSMPRSVVAIGKCAGPLLDGVAGQVEIGRAFCAIPRGYPPPHSSRSTTVAQGGHPDIDDDSFRAGEQLLAFIDDCHDVLFLISGGGSACVEWPLPPFTREELSAANARLVASALTIGEINTVRKHLSAIKGGRLGARVRGRSVSLVYSDVSTGAIGDVASGPTVIDTTTNEDAARILERIGGCERIVAKLRSALAATARPINRTESRIIADNSTLTAAAARLVREAGHVPMLLDHQIETGVDEAARMLAQHAAALQGNEVIVAGGETTVERHGSGRGGRCCEMAVRFAMCGVTATALFGSSDGIDGSSGVAAVITSVPPPAAPGAAAPRADRTTLAALLANSDSLAAANLIGRAIIIPATGNNLRDLFLVSADTGTMTQH